LVGQIPARDALSPVVVRESRGDEISAFNFDATGSRDRRDFAAVLHDDAGHDRLRRPTRVTSSGATHVAVPRSGK
jgi:hypothetical protein